MNWHSISTKKPLHGQRIIPYHPDMQYGEWLLCGLLPVVIWDEGKGKVTDCNGFEPDITHWASIALEPTVKK